jgi:hypothetical protein
METQSNFSAEQSIGIIEKMIQEVREDLGHDSFLYLMWGWLTAIAALTHYALRYQFDYQHGYIAWALMPIGAVVHFVYLYRQNRDSKINSYTQRALASIWIAFFISIVVLVVGVFSLGGDAVYPFFIMLYASAIFATGMILKFNPLIIGGASNWIIAIISFYQPFEIKLLLIALAITLSYIIPGHMLKAKYQK